MDALDQAQEELRQAWRLARATLDGLTAHVCVLDAAGSIISVNRAWSAFASANNARTDAVGVGANYLSVCAAAPGEISTEAPEFMRGLVDVLEGRRETFELQYPCHSPTEQRWFMANVSCLEGCDPARAVVSHQSVTTRVQTEARMREAQRLESLGTLAGGIAHDFNNILTAILGNASLALDPLSPERSAQARIEQITFAAKRGRQLVQQILSFGRRQMSFAEPLALRPLVEETIELLRHTLPAEVVILARLSDAPITVLADATQVQQVLMNLGTNAWHALQGRPGRVTISLAHRAAAVPPAAAEPAEGWAVLSVSDDGVGMSQALRERIFEPFFTTQPPGHGTGLGLSIVHGIVARHGGSVTVETALGQGSAFHVQLPAVPAAPNAPAPPPACRAEGNVAGLRVVYVDDDPVVGTVVQALLERAGCLATYYSAPAAALQEIGARPQAIDLVVTDHSMPLMTGLHLAAEVIRVQPQLPVILLSGYVDDAMMASAAAVGIREVLRKEMVLEELIAAVARAAAAQRLLASELQNLGTR